MAIQDHFDIIADTELRYLEKALGDLDPDDLEVSLSQGVLELVLGGSDKIVVNSHHAAGEIWMAAFRQAWHFAPHEADGRVEWRTATAELRGTLKRIIEEKIGHPISL